MKEKFYLKILLKRLILVGFLMSRIIMSGDDFNEDAKVQLLTSHERYDVEIRAPYYMLSIKPKNQSVFQPFKIYNTRIAKIEWHKDNKDDDVLIVTFSNRKHRCYTLTSEKQLKG